MGFVGVRSNIGWRRTSALLGVGALALTSLVGLGVSSAGPAYAAPGDAFDPADPIVFIAQGTSTQLQRAETDGDGTFNFSDEGSPVDVSYNAMGFNPADNYIYAIVSGRRSTTELPLGSLVRIGESGTVERVGTNIYTHEGGSRRWFSGAVNPDDGLLYITDSTVGRSMHAIDMTTGDIVSTVILPQDPRIQDFAFKDGYAWGADRNGDIRRLDVSNGVITDFPGVLPAASDGYGGVWNFGNGNLGFSANASGDVTQLTLANGDTDTPEFGIVSTVPGPDSSYNDGTAIPGLPVDLEITKEGRATFVSGDRIRYEITVTNNGEGNSSGWTVTDTLPAGLSNPTVIGDFSTTVDGSIVTINGGRLESGESETFEIEVDTDVSPAACVTNTASVLGNEEDPDPENTATAESCALDLSIAKSSDATADSRPGDIVTYTVTATNTGAGDYTEESPAVVFDDLTGVLDDATFNDDLSASMPGTLGYTSPLMSWSGALAVGESVDLTYSVELQSAGDGEVSNVAWAPMDVTVTTPPACDPAVGGVDDVTGEACALVQYDLPRLAIDKTVEPDELTAVGQQASYTVIVTNEGPGSFTETAPATALDDLSEVLDDAAFNDASLSADVGEVVRSGDTLSWSGPLAAGEQATITYSVTYTGEGDLLLSNVACVPEDDTAPGAESCATAEVPGARLSQWKTAMPSSDPVVAGSTIDYTLYFSNDGRVDADVDAIDDLTDVLDDAQVTVEPTSADGLVVVRDGAEMTVSGSVPAGETYVVTYSVTVLPDGERGDSIATNFLVTAGETPPTTGCVPEDVDTPNCTSTPITNTIVSTGGTPWFLTAAGLTAFAAGALLLVRRRIANASASRELP